MQVTIQIAEKTATDLRLPQPSSTAAVEILHTAQQLGVTLEPLHPTANDPGLLPDFVVELQDASDADAVSEAFLRCQAVEGAYTKPPEGPPDIHL